MHWLNHNLGKDKSFSLDPKIVIDLANKNTNLKWWLEMQFKRVRLL